MIDFNDPYKFDTTVKCVSLVPIVLRLQEENKKLKEQLEEANEIIESFRTYDFTINDENAEEYQVKYKIDGKRIYTNRKPPKDFEKWRRKITKSLKEKMKNGV